MFMEHPGMPQDTITLSMHNLHLGSSVIDRLCVSVLVEGMSMPLHPSALQTPPQERVVRRTTPENIRKFFDPNTYQNQRRSASNPCQKRPASETSSSAPPSSKARTMGKDDLVEKFKLAAKLNGLSWDDLAVSRLNTIIY